MIQKSLFLTVALQQINFISKYESYKRANIHILQYLVENINGNFEIVILTADHC